MIPKLDEGVVNDPSFREMAYVFANDVRVLYEIGTSPHHSDYEMLRAAGVLRRLLVDKYSLAPAVAKRLGVKLLFVRYQVWGKETDLKFSDLPELNRITAPKPKPWKGIYDTEPVWEVYRLDDYLKVSLGILDSRELTPKLLITLLANKLGGIHHDRDFLKSDDEDEKVLAGLYRFGTSMLIFDQTPLAILMSKLIFDVFHACSPLLRILVANGIVDEQIVPKDNTASVDSAE